MNAQQNQLDCVTELKRGGKRANAGAKLKHGEKTAVIRLPVSIVEKFNQGLIDFVTLSKLDCVSELQNEINKLNAMITELEDNEKVLVAAVRKKLLKLSPAELAAINEKLKCF